MATNGEPVEEATTIGEAEALVTRCRNLSQRVATYIQRVVGEGEALGDELKMLMTDIARAEKKAVDEGVEDKLAAGKSILHGHGPGGDVTKLLKQKQPSLLRYMLGPSVNVVTLQRKEAHGLKEEYHAFRDNGAYVLCLSAFSLLVGLYRADKVAGQQGEYSLTPPFMVGVQLFLGWLLYFYTAMALRENVLKVNGSNIKQWWIHHHYWAMFTTLIILFLPVDSMAVQMFVRRLLAWSIGQGIVMILQNRYQRRRMYTRIALGKNRALDVVGGEAMGSSGSLYFLYPLLLCLQIWQICIGVQMFFNTFRAVVNPEGWLEMEPHESDLRGSRGVAVAGLLMIFMGVTNMYHTVATLREKRGRKVRAPVRHPAASRPAATPASAATPPPAAPAVAPAPAPSPATPAAGPESPGVPTPRAKAPANPKAPSESPAVAEPAEGLANGPLPAANNPAGTDGAPGGAAGGAKAGDDGRAAGPPAGTPVPATPPVSQVVAEGVQINPKLDGSGQTPSKVGPGPKPGV